MWWYDPCAVSRWALWVLGFFHKVLGGAPTPFPFEIPFCVRPLPHPPLCPLHSRFPRRPRPPAALQALELPRTASGCAGVAVTSLRGKGGTPQVRRPQAPTTRGAREVCGQHGRVRLRGCRVGDRPEHPERGGVCQGERAVGIQRSCGTAIVPERAPGGESLRATQEADWGSRPISSPRSPFGNGLASSPGANAASGAWFPPLRPSCPFGTVARWCALPHGLWTAHPQRSPPPDVELV